MARVKLEKIDKIYDGGNQAVFDFNLEIQDQEFVVFVGPSGCGKSTTLRMIAGLESISAGKFSIDGKLMNNVAPKDRDIAMVFQSYALYPHMTVFDNMAFALKLKKMDKDVIEKKVKHAAKMLDLTDYLYRKPKALSGGQRQRVALGRAIVRNAKLFLMDEPLSNLDAKLRVQTRGEIIKLHRDIKATTIYVTHDQIEAMTMADRIVVMKDGRIQQVGSPKEIYNSPANVFVGGFIGTPPMNFIKGKLTEEGYFEAGKDEIKAKVPEGKLVALEEYKGKEIIFGIRPEDIYTGGIMKDTYSNAKVHLRVDLAELLGAEINVFADVAGSRICASLDAREQINNDQEIDAVFDMNKAHFFDPKTEKAIKYVEKPKTEVKAEVKEDKSKTVAKPEVKDEKQITEAKPEEKEEK